MHYTSDMPIKISLYPYSPKWHYDKVINKESTAENKPLSYNYIHVYHISNGFLYLIDNIRYIDICYFVSKADVSVIN